MPDKQLRVSLLATTPGGTELAATAARLCYSGLDMFGLQQAVQAKDQSAFLKKIVASGHLSVLEHVSFTFAVEGVSRALLAQLTRHRIASYSVQSQRYVSFADAFDYITPPAIRALGEDAVAEYDAQMAQMHRWYQGWQQRLEQGESGNEDARFVLPNASETRLMLTMNARELLHFFRLRCCNRAQWEIRAMAIEMLRLCRASQSALFEDAGPGCVSGACPEGTKTCGKQREIRAFFQSITNPI